MYVRYVCMYLFASLHSSILSLVIRLFYGNILYRRVCLRRRRRRRCRRRRMCIIYSYFRVPIRLYVLLIIIVYRIPIYGTMA